MRHKGGKILVLILPLLLLFSFVRGQESGEGMVRFEQESGFADGIYVDFEMVKSNSPIPKSKILTSADYNSRDFFDKVFESDRVYYYDELGVRQEIMKNDIWGFARNGTLYIRVEDSFNRVTYVGNICHFVADITTYDPRLSGMRPQVYDPYYLYRSPIMSRSYYYYDPYYGSPYQSQQPRQQLTQFIIDFETGNVLEYEPKNVALLLMKDPELHEEFVRLSRRKQRQLMFVYVRKFNEKHPLLIPERQN